MLFSSLSLAVIGIVSVQAQQQRYLGWNYGATYLDAAGTPRMQKDFENDFRAAMSLSDQTGTGLTAARLFTMNQAVQGSTASGGITEALQAAVNTGTHLLLGLWVGTAGFDVELKNLHDAIVKFDKTNLFDLIIGISIGSEDIYRQSPAGIANHEVGGVDQYRIVACIEQTRAMLTGLKASSPSLTKDWASLADKLGHVDVWQVWAGVDQPRYDDLISHVDWIGLDAYPYWEASTTLAGGNTVQNAEAMFTTAMRQVKTAIDASTAVTNVANQTNRAPPPIWVTETGWPVQGPSSGAGIAGIENAQTYWKTVGCCLLRGASNLFWFQLTDMSEKTPNVQSFRVLNTTTDPANPEAVFDMTCDDTS